ncbi:hypothetical protein Agub_g10913, partial [Astrephomene gubernaculifera]
MQLLKSHTSTLCRRAYPLRRPAVFSCRRDIRRYCTRPEVLMSEDEAAARHDSTALLLDADDDHYDGKIISSAGLPADPALFGRRLAASLAAWGTGSTRGVWLRLDSAQSGLVPVAVQQGFEYHHAERDYLMLTRWLPTSAPCTLP